MRIPSLLALGMALLLPVVAPAKDTATEPEKSRWEFALKPQLQLRLEVDSDTEEAHFSMPRARLKFDLEYTKSLSLRFGLGLDDFGLKVLGNYGDVRAYKKHLIVRFGYMKRPFSRTWLTSSASQSFADRTFLKAQLSNRRDLGVMLHNNFKGRGGLRWALGVFTDLDLAAVIEGAKPTFSPTLVGRVGWNMKGLDGYRETDRAREGLRAGGAASVAWFDKTGLRWEVDGMAKWRGLTGMAQVGGRTDADYQHDALTAQTHLGYRVIPELEILARWAGLFPDGQSGLHEVGGGLGGWLFNDHFHPIIEAAWFREPVVGGGAIAPQEGWRVRVQLQIR